MSESSQIDYRFYAIATAIFAVVAALIVFNYGLVQVVDEDEHAITWNDDTNSVEQVNDGLHFVAPGDYISRYHPDAIGFARYIPTTGIEVGETLLYADIEIYFSIEFDDSLAYVENHGYIGLEKEYQDFFMGDVAASIMNTFADSYEFGELPFMDYKMADNTEYPIGEDVDPCWSVEASFDSQALIDQFIKQAGLEGYPSLKIDIPETMEFYQITNQSCEVISA